MHYVLRNTILLLVPFGLCGAKPVSLICRDLKRICSNGSGVDLMRYPLGGEEMPNK